MLQSPSSSRSPTMWMRNCWQVIAFANEIGATPLARTVCNEPIVLFRTSSGEAVALVDRHTFAWVWLGEAALADPALVQDFHWMDDPGWACVPGYHHFGANYQL